MQPELETQKAILENQKTAPEKLKGRLGKMEKRPYAIINQASSGTEHAAVVIGKSTAFKIPKFEGTGLWELYHKQFEAAAAHNQWGDEEKVIALTVHLRGPAQ